ncbi:MAG TPA: hypothetical protein VKV40_14625 [Ktedonobacteraceae bacterium]|jgi:hypothetical protein|nr:hypothetical protein [Ktedonobacteraceae bacterium]
MVARIAGCKKRRAGKESTTPPRLFATLTDIRQTGIQRLWDGTTIYSFTAQISKSYPPIILTLTVSPALTIQAQAVFDYSSWHASTGGESGEESITERP